MIVREVVVYQREHESLQGDDCLLDASSDLKTAYPQVYRYDNNVLGLR